MHLNVEHDLVNGVKGYRETDALSRGVNLKKL